MLYLHILLIITINIWIFLNLFQAEVIWIKGIIQWKIFSYLGFTLVISYSNDNSEWDKDFLSNISENVLRSMCQIQFLYIALPRVAHVAFYGKCKDCFQLESDEEVEWIRVDISESSDREYLILKKERYSVGTESPSD